MAKKAMIEREKKRARLVAKFAEKRAALKEIANDCPATARQTACITAAN